MSNNLAALLGQLDKVGVGIDKQASATAQPPAEGHPTDHIDGHVANPEGETVTSAADEQVARLGNLAAGGTPVTNDQEKKPTNVTTEIVDGTSTPAELVPGEGLADPGPDSDHPASPEKNDKYAGMNHRQIQEAMTKAAEYAKGRLAGLAAERAKTAQTPAAEGKQAAAPAQPEVAAPASVTGGDKYARALSAVIPESQRDAATTAAANAMAPYVQYGIDLANKLANFMAAAEEDPAAAQAMLGEDPSAGMGGADMGGAGMGGAPAGGGDPLQDLVSQIDQVAQMMGIAPEDLMMALAQQSGGDVGGEPAAPAAPAAGGPAPAAAPGDSAPKDSSSGEGSGSNKGEGDADDSSDSDDKTAAAPNRKRANAKEARLRDEVTGLLEELKC